MGEEKKNRIINRIGQLTVAGKTDAVETEQIYQPPKHHVWHLPLAMAGAIAFGLGIFTLLFYTVAHGSLAPVYVAGVPIHATDNPNAISKKFSVAAKDYKLKIQYHDGTKKTFTLADTGVKVDAQRSAAEARKSLGGLWLNRLEWWRPIRLEAVTKTNPIKLQYFIDNYATEVKVPAKNAELSVADGVVTVSQAAQGSGNTVYAARLAIPEAVANLQSAPLVLKPAKLKATILANDLKASKAKAETLVSQPVTFLIAGHTINVTAPEVAGWIDLSPVPSSKTVDVTVDSGKVLQYINAVAKKYIAQPRSRLVANTDTGQVVLDPGTNGIDVVNKDQTAATVAKKILEEKGVNIELPVQYAAAQTVEVQPYDKWFVADVTAKRMYAYEGTTLVKSFLISAGAPATPTVTGTYKIYSRYVSQDMSGNNADGSRYFQPAVPYVNYFYGGYAIHGNYWRPDSWFGNINSSHGCIGVTVADGAWIYDWATIGTPVVIHK